MQSLSGSTFDFSFARPALQNATNYYKHVEFKMLEHFCEKYGGLDEKRRFPMLNKNVGSDRGFNGGTDWGLSNQRGIRVSSKGRQWTARFAENPIKAI